MAIVKQSVRYVCTIVVWNSDKGGSAECAFCQNHEISMADFNTVETVYNPPKALADKALACKSAGNIGVAFTCNETLVGWEYIRDTGALVKKAGMKTVLVTNGMALIETLEEDSAACHPFFPKVPYEGQGGGGGGKSVQTCGNC